MPRQIATRRICTPHLPGGGRTSLTREISELYVSPHESSNWGQDVLGRTTLPHGIGTVVSFDSRILSSCVMDFKIVYRDRSVQVYDDGRNVCAVLAVQFNVRTSVGLR